MSVLKEHVKLYTRLMKKILFLLFSIFFVGQICFSQETELNSELLSVYSETELNQIISEKPEQYQILIYAIDNGVYLADFPKGKKERVEQKIEVPSGDFNFLDLGLKIKEKNQYFMVIGSDKILVVKSFFVLEQELKSK